MQRLRLSKLPSPAATWVGILLGLLANPFVWSQLMIGSFSLLAFTQSGFTQTDFTQANVTQNNLNQTAITAGLAAQPVQLAAKLNLHATN